MYTLLMLVRGFFGFVAAWQVLGLLPVLSWLQDINAVNGNMMAILGKVCTSHPRSPLVR